MVVVSLVQTHRFSSSAAWGYCYTLFKILFWPFEVLKVSTIYLLGVDLTHDGLLTPKWLV